MRACALEEARRAASSFSGGGGGHILFSNSCERTVLNSTSGLALVLNCLEGAPACPFFLA